MGSRNHEVSMLMENGGGGNIVKGLSKEMRHGRTAHNMSSSSLHKKSDLTLVSKECVGEFARGCSWNQALYSFPCHSPCRCCSMLWLWKMGGLLNATCGNATELIIAIFALSNNKIHVVKYSLLGSIISNLLLVLGTSLFCGGIANIRKEQKYDRRQADINLLMLFVALLCHLLPVLFHYVGASAADTAESSLQLSRAASIVMVIAYCAYLVFQLWTHRQLFEAQDEVDEEGGNESEEAVIGFWSAFAWLVGMTVIIALLSEYVVQTIEDASDSWGLSVSFLSIILLPIVGNAAEHAGAIIFAFKNKLDISLGVSLGSATQISMFVVPLCVIVAWIMGIKMDLNFNILETGSFAVAITITAFTLQDGTSHYMKGLVLLLCYIVIGACFFVQRTPSTKDEYLDPDFLPLEKEWTPISYRWKKQASTIVMAAQLIRDRVEMECLEGVWETLEGNTRCRFRGIIRFTATSLVHPDEPARTLQRTVEWILPTPTPYRLVEPVQVIEVTPSEEDLEELPPEPAVDALDFLEGDEDPLLEVDSPEEVMSASEADSTEDSGPREMAISGGSSS
ncbi:Vacuolar cation/proton exchanger 3 [Glycine max]|nr:Vacuolar cation/proton exchanger 3 [Glycine max]